MSQRGSGILLHITSLPSAWGIGDFGEEAYRFVDFLKESNQRFWQILPLNPTDTALGNSPYSSCSAFAGNPLLISPQMLIQDHFLEQSDIDGLAIPDSSKINYTAVTKAKLDLLLRSFEKFKTKVSHHNAFKDFCRRQADWLDDYSLFRAIKNEFKGEMWNRWPADIRERHPDAITRYKKNLSEEILREKFFQYLFFQQWIALKNYCQRIGIKIIGDIPIYVHYDSVDVWANSEIFKLDKEGNMEFLSGVPPDYFSATGQLWGNPVYRWEVLKKTRYDWWKKRFAHNFNFYDVIRIDHFRGFVAYWEVPKGETTAVNGKWVLVPAEDFFNELKESFENFSIIAEDLGYITEDVREVIRKFDFPGMKVLLFAFGGDVSKNPYVPHYHIRNCVLYTGTHDNNTARAWFEREASKEEKDNLREYLGRDIPLEEFPRELVRLAMMSVADTVIFPLQDILGLGEETRMNHPGTMNGNWQWRVLPEQLCPSLKQELSNLTKLYARV